jgi:hypothetical protein
MSREALIFPSTLSPQQRRLVHTLAHHMGLAHISRGHGEQRQVHVFRAQTGSNAVSPSFQQIPTTVLPVESQQRRLHRPSQMDFSDARGSDPGVYAAMNRHSSLMLDVPGSPNPDSMARVNLRGAKSTADLRSYTPSPVPSSASFPATLGAGLARFSEYNGNTLSANTPTLTPTASGNMLRDEAMLMSGLGGLSLASPLGNGLSTNNNREQRSSLILDRDQQHIIGSAIGSGLNRGPFMGFDDGPGQSRISAIPLRQPRGPVPERGAGFVRQPLSATSNRKTSSELDLNGNVEIAVE